MYLKSIELSGFKSFAKKSQLTFTSPIAGVVGPNGSGKSNTVEAFRFVLGEQSMKSMRGKRGPDMIWAGNEKQPPANRARVALTFDNRDNLLDIDFKEVVLERVVHRDGANEYYINGSKVRLRDIVELLSGAHIGASGHHIISQGEADRILGASEKERREILEEALGLRSYQYKKIESEKKLQKTNENIREVRIQQRELAPQIAHLERQMKKLERARTLQTRLELLYATYIHNERTYLTEYTYALDAKRVKILACIQQLQQELEAESASHNADTHSRDENEQLRALEVQRTRLGNEKEELLRTRGRIEGQIALLEQQTHTTSNTDSVDKTGGTMPVYEVRTIIKSTEERLQSVHTSGDVSLIEGIIVSLKTFLGNIEKYETHEASEQEDMHDTHLVLPDALKDELRGVEEALTVSEREEKTLTTTYQEVRNALHERERVQQSAQARYVELKALLHDSERDMAEYEKEAAQMEQRREQLKRVEYRAQDKGIVYTGVIEDVIVTREIQQETLREIESTEARLEESGGIDESIVSEYEELSKKKEFTEKEVNDLTYSQKSLTDILDSLKGEISTRFDDGLEKINEEFQNFFGMLFDGGEAQLHLVKKSTKGESGAPLETEDEESEGSNGEIKEGIEIRVRLPRKKVSTLDVLSGGERALTSIALIFAMSQVNPPPFIILDETDAALDEANSRRYAQMVRTLSEKSQLILITHNRQTMEAAGELYGVTMGSDGISKLLSVKFDEALSVAK